MIVPQPVDLFCKWGDLYVGEIKNISYKKILIPWKQI